MGLTRKDIKPLADKYFEGRMPKELREYLMDRYGDEPLFEDGCLYPMTPILEDIEKYKNGAHDTTLRTPEQKKIDCFEEANAYLSDCLKNEEELSKENTYMHDFIAYMHLEENYRKFRAEAHYEKDENLPLGHYTM
jgi:hypothetical protein